MGAPRRGLVVLGTCAVVGVGGLLSACGSSDEIHPAPQAGSAACKALTGRLPARVLDLPRHHLDVAGAGAWGKPSIVLRCGVRPTGPTRIGCIQIDDLDWIQTDGPSGPRFVTFGRYPAVEVNVPSTVDRTAASGALIDLAAAVRPLEKTAHCS